MCSGPRRLRSIHGDGRILSGLVAPPAWEPWMTDDSSALCAFCEIITGRLPATIVAADSDVVALVDLRQFHPGHVLVIPRQHLHDIREADDATCAAIMRMVSRIARAVSEAFPSDGLSVWHSIGEGANQEVPHLHFHVHPRFLGDDLLHVYPHSPATPGRTTLEIWGAKIAEVLAAENNSSSQ